jgi:hypothetical protein
MESVEAPAVLSRKKIAFRFLYTIFFVILLEILKLIIQLTVVFQYVFLFITTNHNEPLRKFSNKVAVYAYRVIRYVTLSENARPFPFSDFPPEIEQPDAEALFD